MSNLEPVARDAVQIPDHEAQRQVLAIPQPSSSLLYEPSFAASVHSKAQWTDEQAPTTSTPPAMGGRAVQPSVTRHSTSDPVLAQLHDFSDNLTRLTQLRESINAQRDRSPRAPPSTITTSSGTVQVLRPPNHTSEPAEDLLAGFVEQVDIFFQMYSIPVVRDFVGLAIAEEELRQADELAHESRLHPLLEQYYDAAAGVKSYGERLMALNARFENSAMARQASKEKGLIPHYSDDEFQGQFLAERRLTAQELDRRIDLADALKRQCLDMGLDLSQGIRGDVDNDPEDSAIWNKPAADLPQLAPVASSGTVARTAPGARSTLDLAQLKLNVESWMDVMSTTLPDVDSLSSPRLEDLHEHEASPESTVKVESTVEEQYEDIPRPATLS